MEQETKDTAINIRVKPSIKAAAVKKAAEQNRSLTTYIEWLILQDTKRKP
jgi:predicted HicB family RNase H-like nuclease